MADYVYNKAKGTLAGQGMTWKVRSGIPGKFNPISNGVYTVPSGSLMAGSSGYGVPYDSKYAQSAYKDKNGFGWFLWLGHGNLGIHPDGNVPGTQGCIGVINSNTRPLFDKLKQLNGSTMTVLVKTG